MHQDSFGVGFVADVTGCFGTLSEECAAPTDGTCRAPKVFGNVPYLVAQIKYESRTKLYRTARELGLDTDGKVHLRSVRHSAITDTQRKAKGDRMAAKALAGHKHISTTDRYTHSAREDSERALKARFGEYGTTTGTKTSTGSEDLG